MLLTRFFTERYQPDRLFGKSPETSRLIRYSISSFTKTLGHAALIADLTDANIRRHMMRVVNDGRSPATANKDCHQLLAIWRHAAKLGLISTQPTVQTLPQPTRAPRAWTDDKSLPGPAIHQDDASLRRSGGFPQQSATEAG